jgi:antitoxin component YwqK of YwqJK toxin-antitoxin module
MKSNKPIVTLEILKEQCKKYQSIDGFVFKTANDILSKKDIYTKKWLIVMRKCDDTITNEIRYNILNKDYAKCRANKLKVIAIINMNKPSLRKQCVVNSVAYSINNFVSRRTKYKVGHMVECDNFDWNFDEVCSGGIHYFRTLEPAYFYRDLPLKYTGRWILRYNNGEKRSEGNYIDGISEGLLMKWYDNGKIATEGNYINGKKNGKWNKRYDNGKIATEGNYINGKKEGKWIECRDNGNIFTEGNYIDGEKEGEWTTRNIDGTKIRVLYQPKCDRTNEFSIHKWLDLRQISIWHRMSSPQINKN